MLGSIYFAGYSIACFIIPRIADIYGRKYIVVVSLWIQLIIIIGITVSKNFFLTLGFMFFFGTVSVGRSTVNYLYLLELVPKERKVFIGTLINAINECTYIFSSLYFKYVSKEIIWIMILAIIVNLICGIGLIFLPESPEFLYAVKDFDGLRKSLNFISWFNRSSVRIT